MGMGLKEKGMFRHFAILAVALAAPCWAAEQMYSVVLAGSGSTGINAMAVDSQGNAYIAGGTSSPDFPVTPGAYQTQLGGGTFVAKLDPAGKIIWATFLGGKPGAYLNGVAFDPSGNVYVAGNTLSPNFPAASVFPSRIPVNFVAKLSADGSSFIYASLFETGQGGGHCGSGGRPARQCLRRRLGTFGQPGRHTKCIPDSIHRAGGLRGPSSNQTAPAGTTSPTLAVRVRTPPRALPSIATERPTSPA